MANIITQQFDNKIESIEELKQYLEARIQHVKAVTHGKDSNIERELTDILEMVQD